MSEKLIVSKKSLEYAMKLAFLSTEASENTINGHCLLEGGSTGIKVLATDKRNRLSQAKISLASPVEFPVKFTVDPRKVLKLIKTVDFDHLTMAFDPKTLTVQFFLSDNEETFISLPSFDPSLYVSISENFEKAFDLKTVNAGVFLGGLQFIRGFLDQKDRKYSNMYIKSGVMYGTNGNNKAGAFTSPDLKELDELVFPISTFPSIINLIETLDLSDILISTTSNHIFINSPAKDFIYGFTKIQFKIPKIPITVDEPELAGWGVDKNAFLKKLSRLELSGDSKLGIKCEFEEEDKVHFSTVADRMSKDTLNCKRIKESKPISNTSFITECRPLETAMSQFGGNEIELYIQKKVIMYQKAELEFLVQGNKIKKPFVGAAAVALAREE